MKISDVELLIKVKHKIDTDKCFILSKDWSTPEYKRYYINGMNNALSIIDSMIENCKEV